MAEDLSWKLHPGPEGFLKILVRRLMGENPGIRDFKARLETDTSTRLMDWIDHLRIPAGWTDIEDMNLAGYRKDQHLEVPGGFRAYSASGSMLPPILIGGPKKAGLFIKVEDLDAFMGALNIKKDPVGKPLSPMRSIVVNRENHVYFGGIERRGYRGFIENEEDDIDTYIAVRNSLASRERTSKDEIEALEELLSRVREYRKDLSTSRVADAFFWTERRYWESRNPDAMRQLRRQNLLGLGWGNQDHHTYRNSRENLRKVITILEEIGMETRERFYAGEQAGWGAQVLEHTELDTAVFADVDMKSEEKDGDFAHTGLKGREELGTVGLWVALHGESMLAAGLHHLAVRVDFKASYDRARDEGNAAMDPFSDFPYLKQCFTKGVMWNVDPTRARDLFDEKRISEEQFHSFTSSGAWGSHLELIERNQGFKGFNQTAVSDIITRTDPRRRENGDE
jgi:hypothetical protein